MILSPEAHRATDTDDTTMAAFDEREKDFEARYKHDQELQFKVKARRNRLLGLWAAGRMGLTEEDAKAYAMNGDILSIVEKKQDDKKPAKPDDKFKDK